MAKRPTRRSVSAKTEPNVPQVDDDYGEDDWLSSGKDIDKAVKQAQAKARPKLREFFFVKDELNATTDPSTGRPKKKGVASATVHLAVNYADEEYQIAVPRISVKEGGNFRSYTSPGPDCAIHQATGQNPSIRPVYILVDHRSFEGEDGTEYSDMVKIWIPAGNMRDLMDVAIDTLCDAVQIDREDIDISRYPLKITKTGSGRKSAWSVSFVPREEDYSDEAFERVMSFIYGKDEAENHDEVELDGYRAKMRKLLAPDPKYMISKGGSYTPPGQKKTHHIDEDDEEPPF